ncbi:MAG: leucyl aminopeptidase [Mycobacteriales bacterium]
MTTLRLTDSPAAKTAADTLIVGVAQGPKGLVLQPGTEQLDRTFPGGGLLKALRAVGATGKAEELTRLASLGALKCPAVLAVGLGKLAADGSVPIESLRRAAGAAARALAGTRSAVSTLAAGTPAAGTLAAGTPAAGTLAAGTPAAVGPVAEGFLLGAYAFSRYHSQLASEQRRAPLGSVILAVDKSRDKAARAQLARAVAVADSVNLCRDLVNTPAADLHPADLAARAVAEGEALGLKVSVLDEKELAKGGYGGLIGVGQGAEAPPRLVRLAYRGRRSAPTVALVGKGITFDSGGLALKPAKSMETMKCDMSGAAAALASVLTAARLELPVNVTAWLACAENMPSGTAIRPSDVIRIYGGRTVEVLNPDAEGRLVMADAIVRASEEQPDALIDLATLTGAQLIALGARTFAVMGNDDELRDRLLAGAQAAGEAAWPMPLPQELRASLDSEMADLANVGERNGGMLVAGLFLREFVPAGLPWAHLDIAGPAFNEGAPYGYTPKGGTGAGVRTLVTYLESLGS